RPKSAAVAGSGIGLLTSTGPVFPVPPAAALERMSPTKRLPLLFGWVRSAMVALATWNVMSLLNALLAPPPHVVHWIPNANVPVPPPLKAPVCAARVWEGTVWSTVMSARTTPVALNLKAWNSTEPVFTHRLGENRCAVMSTFAPFWDRVTVPNGGVPQPPVPEQWSLVKLNWIA